MVIIKSRQRRVQIRKNPARPSLHLPARIDIGRGSRLLHCFVDDLSEPGARITLANRAKLPREFVLVLTAAGDVRRLCRTLWCDELELGVEFLPHPLEASTTIVELEG
jgi:PilZ domain